MYKCDRCGGSSKPKEKQYRIVSEIERVEYEAREYKARGKPIVDPGGVGSQIVSETILCTKCAKEIAPEIVEERFEQQTQSI